MVTTTIMKTAIIFFNPIILPLLAFVPFVELSADTLVVVAPDDVVLPPDDVVVPPDVVDPPDDVVVVPDELVLQPAI